MNKIYLFAIASILATGLLVATGTFSSSVVAQNTSSDTSSSMMTDNKTGSMDKYGNKTMQDKNMTTGSADNSTGVI